jgi:hypothetical protein
LYGLWGVVKQERQCDDSLAGCKGPFSRRSPVSASMIGHTGEGMPATLTTTFKLQRHLLGHGAAPARMTMDVAWFRAELGRPRQMDTRRFLGIVEDWREGVTPPETSVRSRNRDAAMHRITPGWVKSWPTRAHIRNAMCYAKSASTELSHHHHAANVSGRIEATRLENSECLCSDMLISSSKVSY